MRFIAERLSEEEIGALKEWFKMMDTDNSGTITFEELENGLKQVKYELIETKIKDLMDAVRKIVPPLIYYTLVLDKIFFFRSSKLDSWFLLGVWQADMDNSGTIDYGEFLAATLHLNKLERGEFSVSSHFLWQGW